MNVLLISTDDEKKIIYKTIRDRTVIKKEIIWTDFCGPEELEQIKWEDFDCVLVGFEDREKGVQMIYLLNDAFGVAEEKVIDYYQFYRAGIPFMNVKRIMSNPLFHSYDGLVLGLSHAECGVLTNRLSGRFANLAVSSQDLYYNMRTLEYCFSNYSNKLKDMEYLVLDMYDYTYFNYDTSMTKQALRYYSFGGYNLDPHNLEKNSNYNGASALDEIIDHFRWMMYQGIHEENMGLWDALFDNVYAQNHYMDFNSDFGRSNTLRCISDEGVRKYDIDKADTLKVDSGIIRQRYDTTIEENTEIFYKILRMAYEWNPQMKVFVVIIPRYIEVQKKIAEVYQPWKELFYRIIDDAKQKYPFTFLDFSGHEVATKTYHYTDVSHMNYFGAVKFTEVLNRCIYHIEEM